MPIMFVNGMSVWNPVCSAPEYAVARLGTTSREIVAPLRVRHAERLEEALLRELLERLAAHALRRSAPRAHSRYCCTDIRSPAGIEHLLMDDEVERRHRRMDLRARPAPFDAEQAPLVAQPARVRQQVADRDLLAAEARDLGQIFSNVVVERELAVLREQHHAPPP